MSEHPNVELLKAVLAAFGTQDTETLSQLLADEVVWRTPGRDLLSGERSGRDDVLAHFGHGGRDLDVQVLLLCDIRDRQMMEAFGTPHDQHAFDAFFAATE